MKKIINKRYSYLWDKPNRRYFIFLNKIKEKGLPLDLCVLGASDGNYVIPAAKKGFIVTAIENDPIALYGGKVLKGDKEFSTAGLVTNVKREGVKKFVKIYDSDYITSRISHSFSGVFTSGSIHYQGNSKHSFKRIMQRIQKYVSVKGLLLIEYIHTSKENWDPKRHFINTNKMSSFFREPAWTIFSNKRKTYLEKSNPRNPKRHRIVWGRLYAIRNS